MGVDAGATVAFAVVDLDGNVVRVESGKGWGVDTLASRIAVFSPKIIASDTRPPSNLSKKIAAIFGAKLFFPKHSLALVEKTLATRGLGCKNFHERDALSAAFKAFHKVQNKLKQAQRHFIEAQGAEMGAQRLASLKAQVLAGRRISDLKKQA